MPVRVGAPGAEPAIALLALLDTGADLTTLPGGVPALLGLPQVGEAEARGLGGGLRVPVYAVELALGRWRRLVEALEHGDEARLGRSVLNAWRVSLDGPRQVLRVEPGGPGPRPRAPEGSDPARQRRRPRR